ncbi:ATP-dependent Clp protease proteolytic subunit [Pseudomonas aeruginosa]|nr:ATP-dependent Clp protease proteolytic subunit [Pseudomonas aeruginosa]
MPARRLIEIYIYGEIGFWGITSADFIRDLKAVDDGTSPVLVHFDTIGGDLFDGIAIHNALRALGERCTARIDGACFSAGSVAACGAHRSKWPTTRCSGSTTPGPSRQATAKTCARSPT